MFPPFSAIVCYNERRRWVLLVTSLQIIILVGSSECNSRRERLQGYKNVSDNGANLDVGQLELEEWIYNSRLVGLTDSATSGNKTDFMIKGFPIDQVSSMPFWLENRKKSDFYSSSDL